MGQWVVLALMSTALLMTGCGSRVESATTVAPPTTPAASTSVPAASTSTGPATPVVTTAVATTKATPAQSAVPTTTKQPVLTTSTAVVTTLDTKNEFCAAVKVYAMDNLVSLGEHIVSNPDAVLNAYETMTRTAPADQADNIKKMGPLTRTTIDAVKSGQVTTPEQLQQWLANGPREPLEAWVLAQQVVVPAAQQYCG